MTNEPFGRAYAFYEPDNNIPLKKLAEAMPEMREDARTPEDLQLFLHEGVSKLKLEGRLSEVLNIPIDCRVLTGERIKEGYSEEKRPLTSMKYVLVANYRGKGNKEAASELGDLLNVIHSRFDRNEGVFTGAVVYEDAGEYVLR